MKYTLVLLLGFSISLKISAEQPTQEEKPAESSQPAEPEKTATESQQTQLEPEKPSEPQNQKLDYFAYFNYSPLDLIIPNKFGGTLGWNASDTRSWELEYLSGSIAVPVIIEDLGKITDRRISLIRRNSSGGSFNFSYGLSYFDFSMHLGDEILNRVTGAYPSIDLIRIQSLGFNIGVGNRWFFGKNISFAIDWFSWSQPVWIFNKESEFLNFATNENDRNDVNDALDTLGYFPRLTLLKLQLGVQF